MIRLNILAFAIVGLMPVFAFSASKKTAEEEIPQISDRIVLSLLSTPDVLEWERTKELEKLGKSQIATGNRLVSRPASPLKRKAEVDRERKDGKAMIVEGEANLATATAALNQLRRTAATLQVKNVIKDDTVVYPFEFTPEVLAEATFNTAEKLLFNLWNQGYGRIYFGGAYYIDTAADLPLFLEDPVLTDEIRRDITRLDGTRFTVAGDDDMSFTLKSENGRMVIDFPDRTQVLRHFKSVFILAELVYDSKNDSALLSMRGIDLSTMNVASAELTVITVDEALRQFAMVSEVSTDEKVEQPASEVASTESDPKAPESAADPVMGDEVSEVQDGELPAVYKRFAIQLKDNNNFLKRVSESGTPFVFTFQYLGDTQGFNSRAASMISKIILVQSNLNVSDSDFLPLILQYSDGESEVEIEAASNAIWKVTPLGGGRSGTIAYDVEAVSLIRSEPLAVPVGLMQTALVADSAPVGGG